MKEINNLASNIDTVMPFPFEVVQGNRSIESLKEEIKTCCLEDKGERIAYLLDPIRCTQEQLSQIYRVEEENAEDAPTFTAFLKGKWKALTSLLDVGLKRGILHQVLAAKDCQKNTLLHLICYFGSVEHLDRWFSETCPLENLETALKIGGLKDLLPLSFAIQQQHNDTLILFLKLCPKALYFKKSTEEPLTEEIAADLQKRLSPFFSIKACPDILKMAFKCIDQLESYYSQKGEYSRQIYFTPLYDLYIFSLLREASKEPINKEEEMKLKSTIEENILYLVDLASSMFENDVQEANPQDPLFARFFSNTYDETLYSDLEEFEFYTRAGPGARNLLSCDSQGLYSFIIPTMLGHLRIKNESSIFLGESEKIYQFLVGHFPSQNDILS